MECSINWSGADLVALKAINSESIQQYVHLVAQKAIKVTITLGWSEIQTFSCFFAN
jgi:hypothetical protein